MRRIYKGSPYQIKSKGIIVVLSTENIDRVDSKRYLFRAVVLVDTLNPECVGETTVCHAHGVKKVKLQISIQDE